MTRRNTPLISLLRKRSSVIATLEDKERTYVSINCTRKPWRIETGLFVSPTPIQATLGAFAVVDKTAKLIYLRIAEATSSFYVVDEVHVSGEKYGSADAHFYLVDQTKIAKESSLTGYAGFCILGDVSADLETTYGFIPYGETEVLIDADGAKFLIIKGE